MTGTIPYRNATILSYDCMIERPKLCCLREMSLADRKFSKSVMNNPFLESLFMTMIGSSNSSDGKDLSVNETRIAKASEELKDVGKLFLVHGLTNRARFAMIQKLDIAKCYHAIPQDCTRQEVIQYVNLDLQYISSILNCVDSPVMMDMKLRVDQVLECDVTDLMNLGETNDVGAQAKFHVIPDM